MTSVRASISPRNTSGAMYAIVPAGGIGLPTSVRASADGSEIPKSISLIPERVKIALAGLTSR